MHPTAHHHLAPDDGAHLAPWAYRLLATGAGAIGIAASIVTGQFFVAGLLQLEADAPARDALIAAGVLMIATELAAFFLAALLPTQRLRALRAQLLVCAGALVAFEGATIYLTQRAMQQVSDAQASSLHTRITHLQATLAAQRTTAAALRDNAATQSASRYSWVRQDGANTLRRAADIDQRTAPLAQELAALQAQQRPSIAAALGAIGALAYTVARAVLVSVMGLIMCGAAGALLRAARQASAPQAKPAVAPATPAQAAIKTVAQPGSTGTVAPVQKLPTASVASASGRWRSAAAMPLAVLAAPAVALTAPTVVAQPAAAVAPTSAAASTTPAATPESAPASPSADARYQRLRTAVLAGHVKPSVRAMHAAVGGSTLAIREYQQRLADEGAIQRHGQGYRLAQAAQAALI